jgi:uncharacterized repeat protein (TIGR01451 family)
LATLMLTLSTLGIGSVSAATPSWEMSVTPTPAKVSAGADAGYVVTIKNTGKSNISQVFLTDALAHADGTPAIPDAILDTTYVASSQGSCDPAGTRLDCTLGAIRSGRSATVVVAFSTGTNAILQRVFEANTTGVAGDNPGSSHGDVLQSVGTTTTGTGDNFSGRFIKDDVLIVRDSEALSTANLQSTKVTAPKGAIGVSVADEGDTTAITCPAPVTCSTPTSEIHVDNGAFFKDGFKVEVGAYKFSGQVPAVYHEFDSPRLVGGVTVVGETITANCPKNGTPSANQIPCFSVNKVGGGDIVVVLWLKENGKIRW